MIFPCEKAVWYYLPQIRADLAKELVKTGMTQSSAAKKLGVTPAAVSQYLHKKRGGQTIKSRVYKQEIRNAVDKISEGAEGDALYAIVCKCCQILKKNDQDVGGQCGDVTD
ncbi:MAG: Fis family transcriptional regulator [Chlorobiaceae bacterium]|nr:Fis family transcriptional regulator [Chlorobiaceae bacterium]